MSQGLVTIVIPTHNRRRQLVALLGSIQDFCTPQIELVVVVDDSEIPADLTGMFPRLNVKHLLLPNRVFISRAKNLGWREAVSEYVFFIDDDNVVLKETIPLALDVLAGKEDVGAVMPAVLYKSRPDLVWVYAAPFSRQPPKFELLGRNLPRNPRLEGRYFSTDALPNASVVRREALDEIGGFDERLVVNSSMDLAVRLKRKGWGVFAYTGCFILHDVEPPGRLGWWATHGAADPQRVRYEIRDWFIMMKMIRGEERFFTLRSALQSLRFVLPNAFAYVVRGRSGGRALRSLARGYVEGILESRRV